MLRNLLTVLLIGIGWTILGHYFYLSIGQAIGFDEGMRLFIMTFFTFGIIRLFQ